MSLSVNDFWQHVRDDFGDLVPNPGSEDISLPGRNQNHIVTTDRGQYFVKVLISTDAERRARNSASYDAFAERVPGAPRSPRCLVADSEVGVLVFECLSRLRSGAQLMVDEQFDPGLATRLGASIAALHLGDPDLTPGPLSTLPAPHPRLLESFPSRPSPS